MRGEKCTKYDEQDKCHQQDNRRHRKEKKIGGNMSIKYEDRYFRTKEKNEIPQIESVHILPN